MTVNYPTLFAAIRAGDASRLREALQSTPLDDIVEAATFIGPDRLAAAIRTDPAVVAFAAGLPPPPAILPPRVGAPTIEVAVLVDILRQAFGRLLSNLPLELRGPRPASDFVARGIVAVAARRRQGPLVAMPDDLTGILPAAGAPAPLSEQDYRDSAARNAIEVAAIKAVAQVESGGRTGFDPRNRPKILFEAHYFGRLTAHRFDATHPHLSVADYRQSRPFYPWDQYGRMHEALLLAPDAALMSASWGKFQIMGENHSGWPNVRAFVAAMFESEANHLRAFEAYCTDNGLMGFIRARNWLAFARGYNGPRQEGYDTRIAAAYRAAGGRP